MTKPILTLFLAAALCAALPARAEEPPRQGARKVARVSFDYPGELPEGLDALAGIKRGEPYSPRKVREGIKLLYLKGLFEDIAVEGEETPEGIILVYRLTPRLRISDIEIEGNDELSKKKIRGRMAVREGDLMDDALVEKSRAAVLRLCEEEGFRYAEVRMETVPDDPLRTVLKVIIKEGAPTIVKEIDIVGELAIPEKDLRRALEIRPGKPLRKEDMEQSMNALTELYVKNDYVRAEVELPEVGYSGDGAVVVFHVNAGPKLEVQYEGNNNISDKKLRKALTFWEDRDVSEESISENLDKLRDYYQGEGYYFISVTSRTEESITPPKVSVRFIINEGPRSKLEDIVITGNKELKTEDILKVMETRESSFIKSRRVVPGPVRQDVERIKAYYEGMGFLKPEVTAGDVRFSRDGTLATLEINISEGPRTYVSGVEIKGAGSIGEEEIRKAVKTKAGEPYSPQRAKDDQNGILNLYSQKGYIHASLEPAQELSEDGRKIRLVYQVDEGVPVEVGKVILRGNDDTRDRAILRELLFKEGAPFDYEKILRSQQRIYRLGFFSQVKIEPVEQEKQKEVQDVLLTVKERNAGAVEFGVGYGDFDKFRGFAEVSYRNLFGLAHRLSARGELSTKETKGILTYRWPWFMGYPLAFRSSLVYLDGEKPNYHIRDFIGIAGFDKGFGDHINASLIYQYEKIHLSDVSKDAVLAPEDKKKSNIASISPSVVFDYRDNPFNPTKGSVHALIVKWANTYLGSTVDFVKFTGQTSWYFPLYKGIVAGLSARGGIEGWFSERFEIPISERFFLGGASSLRGYKFETVSPKGSDGSPAGGDSMLLFNAEVRFPLPLGFGLVTFLDAGNVWLLNKNVAAGRMPQTGSNGLRYGAGVGIRYDTPVGPLRLDYGFKLNPLPGESSGELHFTIGQAF